MLEKKKAREAAEAAAQQGTQAPQKQSRKPLMVILAILLVIVGLFMWMNGNKTASDLQVSALNWVRNINIEENRAFSESGWQLPAGAEETDARREIHHYDQVLDHYENVEVQRTRQVIDHYETYYTYKDLGNGAFEQVENERPIYEEALQDRLQTSQIVNTYATADMTQEEKDDPSKLITPAADRLAEAGSIDAAVAKHPDAKLVILAGISPSGESLKKLKLYSLPASRRPRLVIIGLSNLTGWVEKQLENGFFDALIVADLTKSALGITELPDNPLEVFNRYYVLITKDNLRRNRRFFHHQ